MTNFRKTALALASAFMMAGAAGAAGLPDILERDAAGTSAAQKAGAELASRPRTAGASSPKRMPPCSPKP